jgi:hypothetical protein
VQDEHRIENFNADLKFIVSDETDYQLRLIAGKETDHICQSKGGKEERQM